MVIIRYHSCYANYVLKFKVATMPRAWIVNVRYFFLSLWGCVDPESHQFKRINSDLSGLSGQQGALLLFISNEGWHNPSRAPSETQVCESPSPSFLLCSSWRFAKGSLPSWWAIVDQSSWKAFRKFHNFKSKKWTIYFILFLFFAVSVSYLGRSRYFSVF